MIAQGAALLLSAIPSFLGHLALFGDSTAFAQGLVDGLSSVACVAAIVLLVRNGQQT